MENIDSKNVAINEKKESENKDIEYESNVSQDPNKFFSQKELDEIIGKRLLRERDKHSKEIEEIKNNLSEDIENEYQARLESQKSEYEEKLEKISKKENELLCKEYLLDTGMPKELFNILDTSNIDEFIKKAKALQEIGFEEPKKPIIAPLKNPEKRGNQTNAVEIGFSNYKHKPRDYSLGN